jgi:hypothetical protein
MIDLEKATDLNKVYRGIRSDAHEQLTDQFARFVKEQRARDREDRAIEELSTSALKGVLRTDEKYAAEIERLVSQSVDRLTDLEIGETAIAGPSRDKIVALTSGCSIQDMRIQSGNTVTFATSKDTTMDVFTAPYSDSWTDVEGRHQQLIASANKGTGFLRVLYTVGKEGGSTYLGAGVAVLFMRKVAGHPPGQGPAGLAQVRTHTPYKYRWLDKSYLGTAHQHAGFGVLVGSWSINGGPGRVEQDHQRWRWSDSTDWYKQHTNPNWSDFDDDVALSFGDQAPYFPIEPGRMYVAWVWCFAEGDAHGADLTSAAYAQAQIDANVNMIVVGQQ